MECRERRRRRRRRKRNSCGQADGRAGRPIKGSARGPRGPKKKPGYLVGERVDHIRQVNRSIQIQKHYKVDCSGKVVQKLQKKSKKQNKYKKLDTWLEREWTAADRMWGTSFCGHHGKSSHRLLK